MSFYAVIMAGGVGKRFWPESRRATPKQLLPIAGDTSMLRMTVDRLKRVTGADQILIITNSEQERSIRSECPELPAENILIEPTGKNTAPCIGLAAIIIQKRESNAIMGVFPADHHIEDPEAFAEYINKGIRIAEEEKGLAIVPGIAGKKYPLPLIKTDVQDSEENSTEFLFLAKQCIDEGTAPHTYLILSHFKESMKEDDVRELFVKNALKLHSLTPLILDDYPEEIYLIEMIGSYREPTFEEALEELSTLCRVKVLGACTEVQ